MAQERKKFFEVEIPLIRTKIKLMAHEISQLNNRNVKLDLTRMLRGQSMEALIKIIVEENKARGKIARLTVLGFSIRRMMRKSISYVEDSFSAESLDSFLRIKPFLITRKKVTRAVRTALRNEANKYLKEYAKENSTEKIFSDIINNQLQRALSLKMKKIYPLALCEIREIKIEKEKEGVKLEKLKEDMALAEPEQIEQ